MEHNLTLLPYATEDHPIRASMLPKLLECPASALLPRASGSAAAMDMGSLVHSGVEAFHLGKDGVAAIEAAREKFPLGNIEEAKSHFIAYSADEKNRDAEVVRLEQELYCRLDDPQGGPQIVIKGHLDQVRKGKGGRLTVHDIKTGGAFRGRKALLHYASQQAAYTVGARQTWGEEIFPGSLICTADYFVRLGVVHHEIPWSYEDCLWMLQSVADIISTARRGRVGVNPREENCHWCPHKGPETCIPKTREVLSERSLSEPDERRDRSEPVHPICA